MITRMTGTLNRVLDDELRLQVGPIEYQILVSECVRRAVQGRTGEEVSLHISEYLEGNSSGNRFVPRLLGFTSESELDFFDLFCTVEKIGAKKALKAMARPVKEIADAIVRQDAKWLSTLPGIGAATAEQIVTSLKRKVMAFTAGPPTPVGNEEKKGGRKGATPAEPSPAADGKLIDDVYLALMGLGLAPAEARGKLDSLLTSGMEFASIQEALGLIYAQNAR